LILANRRDLSRNVALQAGRSVLFCAHIGPSMNPTLEQSDMLEVMPGSGLLRRGDVILFLSPDGGQAVVHRIIEGGSRGIRTRGDNNPREDPWLLQRSDVVGRVVAAQRSGRRRKIAGGQSGLLLARFVRLRRVLGRSFSTLLHPVYDALARGGVVRRLLPAWLKPHVVSFQAKGCVHHRLMLGRRLIGDYDAKAGCWRIRRPFRLLVSEVEIHISSG
jgi:hypothetical protein